MSDKTNSDHENEPMSAGNDPDAGQTAPRFRRPLLIGGVVASVCILGAAVVWLFGGFGGAGGRPVLAPRNVDLSTTQPEVSAKEMLTLSPEQVKNAGIETEAVGEQMSADANTVASTGTVEANAYRQTPVVTLAGGIVRRVIPELGSTVRKGQAVAIIFSDEFAQTQSRFLSLRTEAANARKNYERTLRLVSINQPGRAELEQATKQRITAEAVVNEARSRSERTTKLLRIGAASREELEQDTTKLRSAEADLDEARRREQRAAQLLPISPEVRGANEEALNKLRSAETELAALRERLILFGMSRERVESLNSPSQITSELAITAPSAGTITGRSVNVGEVVEANKALMQVTDLSSVWVIAQVYERDISRLRNGAAAVVNSDAFPDRVFRGQVSYIDPLIDEATRTAKVRVEVGNPGEQLKVGMYVRVSLSGSGTGERTIPSAPSSAIQTVNGRQVVFLPTEDPNVFEMRTVRVGDDDNGRSPILEGLTVGEKVVTTGSFLLRAEWLKSHQGH
ncbi:MAG: RND family efflux transporter MFP subunit [Acidobacteria bacterium OLB17]|nr:MAG: RND family efflux transporter MFP subunit [Acidobacteria bacterium OLB17]MCZ2391501.1 efflux RND transporter periplasmic adaptor subunit [Acidobacteriota bacterium]